MPAVHLEHHLFSSDENAILFSQISKLLSDATVAKRGGTKEVTLIRGVKNNIEELIERSFSDVQKTVNKYIPSGSGSKFGFKFLNVSKEKEDSFLSELITREVYISDKENSVIVNDLGSGIQQAVVVGLLEREMLKSSKSNLILFEEPESFLHPNAQREMYLKLLGLCQKPSTQGIFSTHSNAVLDATPIESVVAIKKCSVSGAGAITHSLQYEKLGQTTGETLLKYLEIEKTFKNSDLFYSDLVVFVEGLSDKLVLEEATKKLLPENVYRISFIPVDGNSHFLNTVKYLDSFQSEGVGINWQILLDKDSLKKSEVVKELKKIPGADSVDWGLINQWVLKDVAVNEDGESNRNSARIYTDRINKELTKARIYSLCGDIEYLLVSEENVNRVKKILKEFYPRASKFVDGKKADKVASLIGSKGPNLTWGAVDDGQWKKSYLHKAIAFSLKKDEFSKEMFKVINHLEECLKNSSF